MDVSTTSTIDESQEAVAEPEAASVEKKKKKKRKRLEEENESTVPESEIIPEELPSEESVSFQLRFWTNIWTFLL